MNQRKLLLLLPIAAVAVGIQNYVFFSSLPSASSDFDEELADESLLGEMAEPSRVSGPLAPEALAAWLQEQPASARSPFMTRLEAMSLGEALERSLPRLSGTLIGATRKIAWLDGIPRIEGEEIGRHRIAAISRDRVVLRRGRDEWQLRIDPVHDDLDPKGFEETHD